MEYVLLILGFVLLIKGADFFVDGSSSIARHLKVPPILIGLTIVSFGTSAPEAAVSINAAIHGSNEIALGNVIGSNIFNLLVVIGVTAIITPLAVKKQTIIKEFPFVVLATAVLVVVTADSFFDGAAVNVISRADGIILLLLLCIFIYYLVEMAIMTKEDYTDHDKNETMTKSIIKGVIGIAGILLGSEWVVSSSSTIAISFGMSESLVGLTIVAIGTSLPELVTSVVAAIKKEHDIAVGNVVGSNLFNIFFVLGVSTVINPIETDPVINSDLLFLLVITVVTYLFCVTRKKIQRLEAFFLVAMYVAYFVFIIYRNYH